MSEERVEATFWTSPVSVVYFCIGLTAVLAIVIGSLNQTGVL